MWKHRGISHGYSIRNLLLVAFPFVTMGAFIDALPFQPAENRSDLNAMLASLQLSDPDDFDADRSEPGLYHIRFELLPEELEMALAGGKTRPDYGILTIGVPEKNNGQNHSATKVLFTSVTGDVYAPNAFSAMNYYQSTRKTDWLLMTVDANVWPTRDSIQWRLTLMAAAMRFLDERSRALAQRMQLAFGGYSGGSKMALYLAGFCVKLGGSPIGLFLGGCNEAPVGAACRLCDVPIDSLLEVPVVLSIGELDRIARPRQSRLVAKKLKREGFSTVGILSHAGGHQLVPEHVLQALETFDHYLQSRQE